MKRIIQSVDRDHVLIKAICNFTPITLEKCITKMLIALIEQYIFQILDTNKMVKLMKAKHFMNVNSSCIIKQKVKCIECCQYIRAIDKFRNNEDLCQKCNRNLDEMDKSIVSNILKQFVNPLNEKRDEALYSQSANQTNNFSSTELHNETSVNINIDNNATQSIGESTETEDETIIDQLSNSDNITLNQFAERDDFTEENAVNNCLYCVNCKRWNTLYPNQDSEYKVLYEVQSKEAVIKKTSLRRKYSRLKLSCFEHSMSQYSSDSIKVNLCEQCICYFSIIKHTKETLEKSCWPSIFWRFLSSEELYNRHGYYIWRIIPLQWQQWWKQSITLFLSQHMYVHNNISELHPCIIDVTERTNNLEKSIIDGELSTLITSCDNNLLPLVKCPWGCTEYFHMTGQLSIETIFARFVAEDETDKFMSYKERLHAIAVTAGCRNDYLCVHSAFEMSYLLENPIWKIGPSICFKNGIPVFLTCRAHNGGSKKYYLHPPKNPFGSLPSNVSDQISPAVVVPRTIKATKENKYSHSFNMQ